MSEHISRLCPRCGAENPLHLEVCRRCAAPLVAHDATVPVERSLVPAIAEAALPLAVTVGVWLARTGIRLLLDRAATAPPRAVTVRKKPTSAKGQRVGTIVEHTVIVEGDAEGIRRWTETHNTREIWKD